MHPLASPHPHLSTSALPHLLTSSSPWRLTSPRPHLRLYTSSLPPFPIPSRPHFLAALLAFAFPHCTTSSPPTLPLLELFTSSLPHLLTFPRLRFCSSPLPHFLTASPHHFLTSRTSLRCQTRGIRFILLYFLSTSMKAHAYLVVANIMSILGKAMGSWWLMTWGRCGLATEQAKLGTTCSGETLIQKRSSD